MSDIGIEVVKQTRNSKLHQARTAKNDEFYTRLEDIERELMHYREQFRDKVVFLNCDDPETSNFWRYFELNFDFLGLKRLISTHYTGLGSDNPTPSYMLEIMRGAVAGSDGRVVHDVNRTDLAGDGDFRSEECIELLKQSDIVVTNPPFSLFREYVAQLVEHGKKFLILGNMNAITYRDIWPLIQADQMWLGVTGNSGERWFKVPADYMFSKNTKLDENGVRWIGIGTRWFTNMDHLRRHEEVTLFREYDPVTYPKYDNYDAINVNKVADIPVDHDGVMGVPITFLGKHNPDQFEIVGCSYGYGLPFGWSSDTKMAPVVGGKHVYKRILIKAVR